MRKFHIRVTSEVAVELDESKFTDEFMRDFRESFYEHYTLQDHAKYIAQLAAREILDERFIEGYGPASGMGIVARVLCVDVEES